MEYITGRDLLALAEPESPCNLIHQTWKSTSIPARVGSFAVSWSTHHPDVTRVLWTDADNDFLVASYYPEFVEDYRAFPLPIMRVDFVRLLYLHRFGGLYVDLDYECCTPVMEEIFSSEEPISIVRSPFLLCEVVQNSMMSCRTRGHPFWYAVCQNICVTFQFLLNPTYRQKMSGKNLSSFFSNQLTKRLAFSCYVAQITGSSVLDKTLVLHPEWRREVRILDADRFFGTDIPSPACIHHHHNSWVDFGADTPELIALGVGLILLVFGLAFTLGFYSRSR